MADKTEFLQAIDDAILDADSLEQFINGSDSETVLTRLSAEYPTLQKALKELFENGGLPATPFKTKADMEASSLVDGDYAVVTDDGDNSGLYRKEASQWNISEYTTPHKLSKEIEGKLGVNILPNKVPIIADTEGNSPLWIEEGKLNFSDIHQEKFSSLVKIVGLEGSNLLSGSYVNVHPIITDSYGNCAVWVEDGLLNCSGLHPDVTSIDALQENTPNNTSGASYPVSSDGATLRKWKSKISRLKLGENIKAKLMLTGDSWFELPEIPTAFKTFLPDISSLIGDGWINMGWGNRQLYSASVVKQGEWVLEDISEAGKDPLQKGGMIDGFNVTNTVVGDSLSVSNIADGNTVATVFYKSPTGNLSYSLDSGEIVQITQSDLKEDTIYISEITISNVNELKLITTEIDTTIYGVHLRGSSSGIELNQMGNGSSTAHDFKKVESTDMSRAIGYLDPDLVIIILGTNDAGQGESTAMYKEGLEYIIDTWRSLDSNVGIILVAPSGGRATMYNLHLEIPKLALEKGVEYYNMYDEWLDYNTENSFGMWKDSAHLSSSGATRLVNSLINKFELGV